MDSGFWSRINAAMSESDREDFNEWRQAIWLKADVVRDAIAVDNEAAVSLVTELRADLAWVPRMESTPVSDALPQDERLASVAQAARVEQIQKAIANGDDDAEGDALTMIAEIAEQPNGPMFLISGVGAMLAWMAKND